MSHLAVCEHCGRARPLHLYRLRSRFSTGHKAPHYAPCSAICERCAIRVGNPPRWFATGKAVAA